MAYRHILRCDGGVRTMSHANRHHFCGSGPSILGISGSDPHILFWRLPENDELRVAGPVAVVLLATVPRCNSRTGN